MPTTFYNVHSWVITLTALILLAGCSSSDTAETTINGRITVADSVDNSGDYSGIGITVIKKDSANTAADTLYHALTEPDGSFSGEAQFPERRQYQLLIARNNRTLGSTAIILAANAPVTITGELPNLAETLKIESPEHAALDEYRRLQRGFQRVGAYARAGQISGDSLEMELKKWPDLFWETYQKHPQTLAGQLAAQKTIQLQADWAPDAMMQKVRSLQANDDLAYLGATYGKVYVAQNEGYEAALQYLDSLAQMTDAPDAGMRIQMQRISLMYDSAQTQQAQAALQDFKNDYDDNKQAQQWASSKEYDLNYLAPGDPIPAFSFTVNDSTISREALKGRAYLLELTSLASPLYQQQYDRSVVIHSIYKNYGFTTVTIPLDTAQVTINAFYSERPQPWAVAPANTFARQQLIDRFNLTSIPTRFLVNKNGMIERRYTGRDFDDVIRGIQQMMNKQ